MIGVDPADDQSFELRSKESKPSTEKNHLMCKPQSRRDEFYKLSCVLS